MKRSFLLFGILMLLNFPCSYSQDLEKIDEDTLFSLSLEDLINIKVKVSSTVPKNIFDTPSTTMVIDRETINKYNFMSVAEAIRTVAGVEILQTNLDRNVPTFRGILQNYYANKILILINNIPTWQPVYGNGTLDRISINDIEKIEVLKGPASVLYGTNAFNGVINLILRDKETTGLNAKIDAGYPGLSSTSANFTYKVNDFKFFVSGNSLIETRNPYFIDAQNDSILLGNNYQYGNLDNYQYTEEFKNYSINFLAEYKTHSFYFNTFNNTFTYPGVDISYATGGNLPFTDKGILLAYQNNPVLSDDVNLFFQTNFEYFNRDWKTNPDRTRSLNLTATRLNSQLKLDYNINDQLNLELGSDFTLGHSLGHKLLAPIQDSLVRMNMKNDEDMIEWSLFAQANYKINSFSFLLGSRYTGNKIFGSNLSSRATVVWKINPANSFKIIFGQSFRTPNMLELYFDHPTVVGNTDLLPETSNSFELVYLSHLLDELFFQATAYTASYHNFITRVRPDITKPAIYRNRCEFWGNGIEVEIKYHNPELVNGFLNYSYISGSGSGAEANFQFIPKHTISFGANKNLGSFNIAANGLYYSDTRGILNSIPAQFTLDLKLSYSHNASKFKLTHSVTVNNINQSEMLIPEYIRKRPDINELKTTAYGSRIIYSLSINY